MVKIIYHRILNAWYVVRGPHNTPITGGFDTKQEAEKYLKRRGYVGKYS